MASGHGGSGRLVMRLACLPPLVMEVLERCEIRIEQVA